MLSQDLFFASGKMMPDFQLFSLEGRSYRISIFRSRQNLVVLFSGEQLNDAFQKRTEDLSRATAELEWEDTQVLLVCPIPVAKQLAGLYPQLRFPILLDHQKILTGRVLSEVTPAANAVVITDRYGEIHTVLSAPVEKDQYTGEDILEVIRFIELQCPE